AANTLRAGSTTRARPSRSRRSLTSDTPPAAPPFRREPDSTRDIATAGEKVSLGLGNVGVLQEHFGQTSMCSCKTPFLCARPSCTEKPLLKVSGIPSPSSLAVVLGNFQFTVEKPNELDGR